jgi:lysophospholipase L1-like esterase
MKISSNIASRSFFRLRQTGRFTVTKSVKMKTSLSFLFALFLISCNSQDRQVLGLIKASAAVSVPLNLTNVKIVADGNSYVQGNGYTPFSSYIMQQSPFTTNGATMANFGVGGQTTQQMLADQSSQVLSLYTSGRANILLVCEGGNDIYYHGDAAAAVAAMKNYCNNARAVGFRVIVTTTIPRDQTTAFGDNPTSYNAKLVAYNNGLIADNSFYDALIRPDLETIFSSYTAGGYDADKVHPNSTGQQKLATLYRAAILSLTQ